MANKARRARRKWTKEGTEESWIEYNQATNEKKKQIRKDKIIGWRAAVSEAATDPTKIWKLAKWAKQKAEERRRLPHVPEIIDETGKIHTKTKDKVKAMAKHFFPPPVQVDLEDIEGFIYPRELDSIPITIEVEELEAVINKLPNDKAPGPDGIPNRFLKQCIKSIGKPLTNLFNSCLSHGYHPQRFKESTTLVFRKPQKPNYNTPKAYRPIALLNTIGKVL